ncbi:hypothetical protein ACPUEJ_05000 [Vibrio tubiashii]|uniref:hypothetical protein n=1 Tax=Vibrio tubiashii TaxID=29498 RepID=UPI003CE54592
MCFSEINFYEVTENYYNSEFHFYETDIRTFEIVYDEITSFESRIVIKSTGEITDESLKKIYRYADGFLIDQSYVDLLSSLDIYNISILPTVIVDGVIEIKNYYYLKVHSVRNCIDFEKSDFYKSGFSFSFKKMAIDKKMIDWKDRIFFVDDEYSILMDEEIAGIFDSDDLIMNHIEII